MTSFAIDLDGQVHLLDRQRCGGAVHVTVHPGGQHVFAAIPRSYCVMAFPLGPDGRVGPPSGIVQHQGWGVNPSTWHAPFPHSVYCDASGKRALACDMGLDRIMLHDFDSDTGRLQPSSPHAFTQLSSGAGPRHLAIHPNGKVVYTVNELSSTISGFSYDSESAAMRILATVSTIPEGFHGQNSGSEIVVHPAGGFVYSSNRGHNSIVQFAINQHNGSLRLVGWEPTQGETPRNFNIDPTGRFMLVANQRSGNIVSFRIEETSGELSPTGHSLDIPSPVCIVFRHIA
jgi:6-phosphogluconolactonase